MPRAARLDIPGLLQHVIIRGIEKRDIFLDDQDREKFLRRFSDLLQETGTDCLAWVLMSNHAHFLLRPKEKKLSILMRRLLTGYSVNFNLRHHRSGHLFQNRYKSIVCEEEPYLLELIRYIHLNPVRAGLVKGPDELDEFKWSGHGVILGRRELAGQSAIEVLQYFGKRKASARRGYRRFIRDGISQGKRDDLTGGGLRRSSKLGVSREFESYDERVLGSGEFVDRLREEKSLTERLPKRMSLDEVIKRTGKAFGISPEDLRSRKRSSRFADARAVISYLAVREMGHNGAEVARKFNITRSGVSLAASRGEEIVRGNLDLQNIIRN